MDNQISLLSTLPTFFYQKSAYFSKLFLLARVDSFVMVLHNELARPSNKHFVYLRVRPHPKYPKITELN